MIRREAGRSWLVISQVDHARIAAEIATVWGSDELSPLPWPEILVPAIRMHDDGWKEWEAEPQVDPVSGGPRNFTEMPMPEATAIWSRSIAQAAKKHPLAGLWVSKHFAHLAMMARPARRADKTEKAAIDQFVIGQKTLRSSFRRAALSMFHDIPELEAAIEVGFKWLQFFDALSLWICCALETEPATFSLPDDRQLTAQPQSSENIVLTPWPLKPKLLTLSLSARRIVSRPYPDAAQLEEALLFGSPASLHWRLKVV